MSYLAPALLLTGLGLGVVIAATASFALSQSADAATVHGYRTALPVGLGVLLAAVAIVAATTRKP